MLIALIMAGGKGTRFWPASTEKKPKQFLSLIAENTMIQETVRRILPLIDIEHIFICTGARYKDLCKEQFPDLPEKNIIIEPTGRNTAPCILLSTLYISQNYPNANIIVLPSDALVTDEIEQIKVFRDADKFLESSEGIITVGITPNRPETNYGYIRVNNESVVYGNHEIKGVDCFKEKPDIETAKRYIADGNYLWNAGIFAFNADFMIKQYEKYAPNTYKLLMELPQYSNPCYMAMLKERYSKCEAISVDYSIMEKTDKLFVIPADFGWDDVGTWMALGRFLDKDENGNITKGDVCLINSKNNVAFTTTKLLFLLDAEDLFVIESENCIVVGKKEALNKVHELR